MTNPNRGMTLVELLIVLTILAGLVATVAVNTAGLQSRRQSDDTTRIGDAVSECSTRTDGLSFISDFGEFPNDIARLQLLFAPTYTARLEPDPDRDSTGFVAKGTDRNGDLLQRTAPEFTIRESPVFPDKIEKETGTALPVPDTFVSQKANAFRIALPCGWRGPYCKAKLPMRHGVATDGFGGAWHLQTSDGADVSIAHDPNRPAVALVSYGQDQRKDTPTSDGTHSWQDKDRRFDIRPPKVTLTVSIDAPSGVKLTDVHCYMYSPKMTWPTASAAENVKPEIAVECRYFDNAKTGSGLIPDKHLTVGLRAFFIWATASDGSYCLPPVYLTLKPGNNTLTGTLRKATDL